MNKKQCGKFLKEDDMKDLKTKGLNKFQNLVQVCEFARNMLIQEQDQEDETTVRAENNHQSPVLSEKFVQISQKSLGMKPINTFEDAPSFSYKQKALVSSTKNQELCRGFESAIEKSWSTQIKKFENNRRLGNDVNDTYMFDDKDRNFEPKKEKKRPRRVQSSDEECQVTEYTAKKHRNRQYMTNFKAKHAVAAADEVSLPVEFRNQIREIGGIDIKLIIQKKLYITDVASCENRFSIPKNQIKNDFLTKEEDHKLGTRTADHHLVPIVVPLIEPNLGKTHINLKKWNEHSPSYVLAKPWNAIRDRNQLKAGMEMQVWSFRVDGGLHMALVKVLRYNEQDREANVARTCQNNEERCNEEHATEQQVVSENRTACRLVIKLSRMEQNKPDQIEDDNKD